MLIKQNILTLKVQHGHVKTFLQLDKWGEMNKYSVPKKKGHKQKRTSSDDSKH